MFLNMYLDYLSMHKCWHIQLTYFSIIQKEYSKLDNAECQHANCSRDHQNVGIFIRMGFFTLASKRCHEEFVPLFDVEIYVQIFVI